LIGWIHYANLLEFAIEFKFVAAAASAATVKELSAKAQIIKFSFINSMHC